MVTRISGRQRDIMFMNTKVVDLYLEITTGPLNKVCNELELNYSHALKLLKLWESMGLIKANKSGFRYNIFYTAKGGALENNLLALKSYLSKSKIQW